MTREVLINTPENIAIEYELAGLGSRFVANFVDTLIQLAILFAVSVAAFLLWLGLQALASGQHIEWLQEALTEVSEFVIAAYLIVTFLIYFGFYIYYEYRWNGQTPGKRGQGLRVIREGGYPVDLVSVVLRSLMRLIDLLPICYLIGIASITLTKQYQRLGDIVAGTIVVKQRSPTNLVNLLHSTRLQPEHLDKAALALMQKEARRLSPEEYQAVRHFTERRRALPDLISQQSAAQKIALPLMARLGIEPPAGTVKVDYADVLEYLAVAYEISRRPQV